MTPVYTLWDLDTNAAAHDPQGCYGDGLCPLAVYTSPEMAHHALEQATAQRKRVEVCTMVLADPPTRAELPTLELDELELSRSTWVSPEVAAVCRGSLTDTLHRPSSPERSERDYEG